MAEMKGRKKRLSVNLPFLNVTDSLRQNTAIKSPSPRVFPSPNGGVGLGILAAANGDPPGQDPYFNALRSPVLAISPKYSPKPIPILKFSNSSSNKKKKLNSEGVETCEEYTCVISHVGDNRIKKREYYEADYLGDKDGSLRDNDGPLRDSVVNGNGTGGGSGPVPGSSPRGRGEGEDVTSPIADFLNSCFLCKKALHGLDIFIYRGEKAFCSAECRDSEISMDEKKDKCHSGARNPVEHSASPCSTSQFFAGVAAA